MGELIKILGFAGSLRKESYNRSALRAAVKLVPQGAQLDTFELDFIPPFNQDHKREPPHAVRAFKAAVKAADAILIVTPEYNYSVPGVLKNAIDWALPALWGQRMGRKDGWRGKRFSWNAWYSAGAISPAPNVCLSPHVPVEPARSHDLSRRRQV